MQFPSSKTGQGYKPLNPIAIEGAPGKVYTWAMPAAPSNNSPEPLTPLKEGAIKHIFFLATEAEWKTHSKSSGSLCKLYEEAGYKVTHFPIEDGQIPDVEGMSKLVGEIEQAVAAGENVVYHCRMGMGRTALVTASLACKWFNMSAKDAALWASGQISGASLSAMQSKFLRDFEASLPKDASSSNWKAGQGTQVKSSFDFGAYSSSKTHSSTSSTSSHSPSKASASQSASYLPDAPAPHPLPPAIATFDPAITKTKSGYDCMLRMVQSLHAAINEVQSETVAFSIDPVSGECFFGSAEGGSISSCSLQLDIAQKKLLVTLPPLEGVNLSPLIKLQAWIQEVNSEDFSTTADEGFKAIFTKLEKYGYERVLEPYSKNSKSYENNILIKMADGKTATLDAHHLVIDGRDYIACSEPSPANTDLSPLNFWTMVFEHQCPLILRLGEPAAKSVTPYWPALGHKTSQLGPITVTLAEEKIVNNRLSIRTFTVRWGKEERSVKQIDFSGWVAGKVPETDELQEALSYLKKEENVSSGPVVVHCKKGQGRTGTTLAILAKDLPQMDAALYVRNRRPGETIQSLTQYRLIQRMRSAMKVESSLGK